MNDVCSVRAGRPNMVSHRHKVMFTVKQTLFMRAMLHQRYTQCRAGSEHLKSNVTVSVELNRGDSGGGGGGGAFDTTNSINKVRLGLQKSGLQLKELQVTDMNHHQCRK